MKINFLLASLLLLLFVSCGKEEMPVTDCSTINLEASMVSEDFEVYRGEPATLTITGTPNSIVKMEGGAFVSTIPIGPAGVTSHMVVPQIGTSYRLFSITTETEECQTDINSVAVVLVRDNPFSNLILNTWQVRNDNSGVPANTVTFNSGGTGSAPAVASSAFSQSNPDDSSIYSSDFTFTYTSGDSVLKIIYQFPGSSTTLERNYLVEEHSVSQVIIRELFGDEIKFILRP